MNDTLGKNATMEMQCKVKEETESLICNILEEGIKEENIDLLGKVVDIHKDIANENYWKIKEENIKMRYSAYSAYGRDEYGEGYGRYGRRGVRGTGRGRYRGEDMIDEMAYHYGNYSESGQYGAEQESSKALEAMMEATVEFIKAIKEEAKSPEEMQIIKHFSKKISEI